MISFEQMGAVFEQLNAGRTLKYMARQVGLDYHTFTRYVRVAKKYGRAVFYNI